MDEGTETEAPRKIFGLQFKSMKLQQHIYVFIKIPLRHEVFLKISENCGNLFKDPFWAAVILVKMVAV